MDMIATRQSAEFKLADRQHVRRQDRFLVERRLREIQTPEMDAEELVAAYLAAFSTNDAEAAAARSAATEARIARSRAVLGPDSDGDDDTMRPAL